METLALVCAVRHKMYDLPGLLGRLEWGRRSLERSCSGVGAYSSSASILAAAGPRNRPFRICRRSRSSSPGVHYVVEISIVPNGPTKWDIQIRNRDTARACVYHRCTVPAPSCAPCAPCTPNTPDTTVSNATLARLFLRLPHVFGGRRGQHHRKFQCLVLPA